MVHKWLLSFLWRVWPRRCAVYSNLGESKLTVDLTPLPYHLSLVVSFRRRFFSLSVAFFTWRAHALIVSYLQIIVLSATLQASFGTTSSYFRKHITIGGYPFIRRTTTRRTTHVLKHPGYWCYPGVESRSFTGAWAGRCVIAHLDDCWGLSSKVSGIVSPDVAPLTMVKRRLVVSVFDMGTWHGETLTMVSLPSFHMILF